MASAGQLTSPWTCWRDPRRHITAERRSEKLTWHRSQPMTAEYGIASFAARREHTHGWRVSVWSFCFDWRDTYTARTWCTSDTHDGHISHIHTRSTSRRGHMDTFFTHTRQHNTHVIHTDTHTHTHTHTPHTHTHTHTHEHTHTHWHNCSEPTFVSSWMTAAYSAVLLVKTYCSLGSIRRSKRSGGSWAFIPVLPQQSWSR